jgi:alkanesulfonate monooxygenase SsuD/methylene tetrahydromethanopterin reductase-like flavin-dependent oxidoreductase (luciferase family)
VLIGGNGERRTLPLVAAYADEWNGVFVTAARYAELNRKLSALLEQAGRDPAGVRRSLMTEVVFGRSDAEVQAKLEGQSIADLQADGIVVGTPDAVRDQLAALEAAGVQRVMLQWLDLDDLDGLAALAAAVLR